MWPPRACARNNADRAGDGRYRRSGDRQAGSRGAAQGDTRTRQAEARNAHSGTTELQPLKRSGLETWDEKFRLSSIHHIGREPLVREPIDPVAQTEEAKPVCRRPAAPRSWGTASPTAGSGPDRGSRVRSRLAAGGNRI